MNKLKWLLILTSLWISVPTSSSAQSTDDALDQLSNEFRALQSADGVSSSSIEEAFPQQGGNIDPSVQTGFVPQNNFVPSQRGYEVPNVIGNTGDGIGRVVNSDRFIDPITGRISGTIDRVTGKVNDSIDRALSGVLSPIDDAIQRQIGSVEDMIDRGIARVLGPVDKAIEGVVGGIESKIDEWLGGLFGDAVEDAVGGVLGEATGGILGGLLGGDGERSVEKAYDPLSPASTILSSATFSTLLERVTSPYTSVIPFESAGMGLPDYSMITPMVSALVAGENGNPNRVLQGADRFSTSPQGLSLSLTHAIERTGSRAIADATLSKTGQELMKADRDGARETLAATIELADDAQGKDVTQDIMKNVSAQLAQDNVLRAGQYQQSMMIRQQLAADAVVNTEISELLAEQNRTDRASLLGNAAAMHTSTSAFYLPGECGEDPPPHCLAAGRD